MQKSYLIRCKLLILLSITLFPLSSSSERISDNALYTNVPDVTAKQLQPHYWLANTKNKESLLLTTKQINTINQQQFNEQRYLKLPLSYPDTLSAFKVKALINEISTPAKADRFYQKGKKLSMLNYQDYIDNMALNTLTKMVNVRYALVTQRTSLRTFPTADHVFNAEMNADIDRFQESAVFPGEALAVLHISKDQQWAFVQNYHYRAWLQLKDIAFAPKHIIKQFTDAKERLVITGAKVFTPYNPDNEKTSEIALEMGVSLPLVSANTIKNFQVSGQNPYSSHIVLLPTSDKSGNLVLQPTLISRSADVSVGYLPLSKQNLIKQAFKFLGERYGWGHDFNARDCSGFIGEIYKSFGLYLPRNTGQQAKVNIGKNTKFEPSTTLDGRHQALKKLKVGDLIYLPGHVAMFLGYDQNKPYIIHDVHAMEYVDTAGQVVSGMLNGVSVTPLLPFKRYVDTMYNIKRLH